jgi:murein DD-endopeptidase MepM/ murein hydrolase activator NlpD
VAVTAFLAKKAAGAVVQKIGIGPSLAIVVLSALMFVMGPIIMTGLVVATIAAGGQETSSDCGGVSSGISDVAAGDIPAVALAAYQNAGKATGIDWVYLAGIGKVESNHGSFGGAVLGADGSITPPIIGIPLNGSNGTQKILDTDGGQWDGDTVYDRAVGPMQFIPSTWATAGKDGNADGVNDPNNLFDAILATAYNLKANGAPGDMRAAIFAYNHSDAYVDKVMQIAGTYSGTSSAASTGPGGPASAAPAASTTGSSAAATATPALASTDLGGTAASDGGSTWVKPVKDGDYTITSRFGTRVDPINGSSAFHDGLDFAGAPGVTIMAVAPGTVVTAGFNSGGFGNWVRIDHGGGVITLYGHMLDGSIAVAVGDQVTAGQVIGGIGSTGRSTGNHLHFGVYVNGTAVDPETYLAGAGNGSAIVGGECGADLTGQTGNAAWGGHQNGRIDLGELCIPQFASSAHLRCDASGAIEQLNTAYFAEFATDMTITDSYRSYEAQVSCRERKGDLCADPGTSNHGWGMAVDFGGGIEDPGSPEHQWMLSHASDFGWVLPTWAGAGGSKPEPWHWEYGTIS